MVQACDICDELIPSGTGQTTADTRLCDSCIDKANRDQSVTVIMDTILNPTESK